MAKKKRSSEKNKVEDIEEVILKKEDVVEEIAVSEVVHDEPEKEVIKKAEAIVEEEVVVEKKEKESLAVRLVKRKEHIKETFLECIKKHHPKAKFNYNTYMFGASARGLLCRALDGFNNNDRKLFQEVLKELDEDKILYHIGGSMYTLT